MKATMKHIRFVRDDIQIISKRLNELTERVLKLESSISKKK